MEPGKGIFTIRIPACTSNGRARQSGSGTAKNKKAVVLQDYVEIAPEHLKFLYGCWIKFVSKDPVQIVNSGGFLSEVSYPGNHAFLRVPQNKEIIRAKLSEQVFYCKTDTENYRALQELLLEKSKFKIDLNNLKDSRRKLQEMQKLLNNDIKKFNNFKENFYDSALNGSLSLKK